MSSPKASSRPTASHSRHPGESRDLRPAKYGVCRQIRRADGWVPAFAGMTARTRTSSRFKVLVPLFGLLALAGCAESGPDFDDSYVPILHYERYPIQVVKGEAKVGISGKHAYLTAEQADVVARFAQQALTKSASVVHVKQPSGGGRS